MSRPLFEHITHPEPVRLSTRLKAVIALSAILVHVIVLYFLFTAKIHYKILKLPAKVYNVQLAPPLPQGSLRSGGTVEVVGALPAGGGLGSAPGSGARVSETVPGEKALPAGPGGPAAGTAPPFTLRVPVAPGPLPSKESPRGVVYGSVGGTPVRPSLGQKFWSYTQTDLWGRRPGAGSGPEAGESPGGPLGSPYQLIRSNTGNKIIYQGQDSVIGRGYNLSPWAQFLVGVLQRNWLLPATDAARASGKVGITIVVEKSGALSAVRVIDSPNDQLLVRAALDAIKRSLPLPRLPDDYPGARLEAYLVFDYHESK